MASSGKFFGSSTRRGLILISRSDNTRIFGLKGWLCLSLPVTSGPDAVGDAVGGGVGGSVDDAGRTTEVDSAKSGKSIVAVAIADSAGGVSEDGDDGDTSGASFSFEMIVKLSPVEHFSFNLSTSQFCAFGSATIFINFVGSMRCNRITGSDKCFAFKCSCR